MLKRSKYPQKVMVEIGAKGHKDVMDHFRKTDGGPRHGTWKALSYRKGRPLQKTGNLRGSVNFKGTNKQASVFTNHKFAAVHNEGRIITPKKAPYLVFKIGNRIIRTKRVVMPQRKFMWISKSARQRMGTGFAQYIVRGRTNGS